MKKLVLAMVVMALMVPVLFGVIPASGQGDIIVTVDGNRVEFPDAKPFVDENWRTLIPVRFVTEDLGAEVEWDAEEREVYITKGSTRIMIRIDQRNIVVNGKIKTMDTNAIIKEDRTYVPIRYVAEELGATVGWDAATRTVIITTVGESPEPTPTPIPSKAPTVKPTKDPVTGWIKVRENLTYVEFAMTIPWDPDNEILNKRYDAAEKMLAERYGEEIAKEVFAYVRLKQTGSYVLEMRDFKLNNQIISVSGSGGGLDVQVWKEGAL
jgi:hypothetical protein